MTWLRRLRDLWLTLRTHRAIANRECRHDGTDPLCDDCERAAAGW